MPLFKYLPCPKLSLRNCDEMIDTVLTLTKTTVVLEQTGTKYFGVQNVTMEKCKILWLREVVLRKWEKGRRSAR